MQINKIAKIDQINRPNRKTNKYKNVFSFKCPQQIKPILIRKMSFLKIDGNTNQSLVDQPIIFFAEQQLICYVISFFYQIYLLESITMESIVTNTRLQQTNTQHREEHIWVGELLKSIIYGGVDGTINTAIIIISGVSSGTSLSSLFAITIAAIVAGAIDMAFCDYISAKAEMSYIKKEEEREFYQVRNMLNEERAEIIQIYQEKGYSKEQCIRLAELYSTNEQAFVNIMMLEELGLVVIYDQNFPLKCGLATLLSFSLFGFITASPYIANYIDPNISTKLWPFVLIISGVELMSLGFAKSLILGIARVKAMIQILLMGSVAIGVGYAMGVVFKADH